MLATFNDFIKQNPNCKKFENDDDMQNVFDFLSQDFIIVQMGMSPMASMTACASARGFMRACLASTMAALHW